MKEVYSVDIEILETTKNYEYLFWANQQYNSVGLVLHHTTKSNIKTVKGLFETSQDHKVK